MRTNSLLPTAGLVAAGVLGLLGGCEEQGSEADLDTNARELIQAENEPSGGSCEQRMPASFALEGCDLPPLCQVTHDGCGWEATCGAQKIGGADANSLSSFTLADGRRCTGKVVGGVLEGSCAGEAGVCSFRSDAELLPTPFCVELPPTLEKLDVCAEAPAGAKALSAASCEVVQNGCSFQARCEGGATFAGAVTPTGLRWDTPENFRCVGTLADGKITGACTQRLPRGSEAEPATCGLSSEAVAPPSPITCEQELPTTGFVIKGCGKDGTICHMSQRGCIWQATCGSEVFAGRVSEPGVYAFTTKGGARCSGKVQNGAFVASCTDGERSCTVEPTEPAKVEGCYSLPPAGFTTAGCGGAFTCDVLQSGCKWQAKCASANNTTFFGGDANEVGIIFPGLNDYACWANKEPSGARLVGGCSLNGTEVSECSERVEGGQLVLTPR